MGVHGLWRLIEPSGKPVPLETLENKVLAVDVSIWLHQAIKGFQDSKGAPVPNAHLLGIYHRVCKLLYFKIKPVFIFDGGVPVLKKQTIAKRNQAKSRNLSEAERLQTQLIATLLKHSAVSKVLSEKTKASLTLPPKKTSKNENMYALPSPELDSTVSSSEEEVTEDTTDTTDSSPTKHWDVHTIDMSSVQFKSLPVDVRHEILTELKETRKQNSWGRLHELPKQSDDFSSYQMNRLRKRQAVQSALEEAEKEMGGHSLSLAELESLLKDHGVITSNDIGKRIASDENTRYVYIKDVKQALEKARREQLKPGALREEDNEENEALVEASSEQLKPESLQEENSEEIDVMSETKSKTKADLEFEEDLEKAIALSLQEEPSTSKVEEVSSSNDRKSKLKHSFLENFNDADFESDVSDEVEEMPLKKFSSAQNYMMEYSGLTPNEVNKILRDKTSLMPKGFKSKKLANKKQTVIEIMSDDDEKHDKFEQCAVSSTEQKIVQNNLKSCDTFGEMSNQIQKTTEKNYSLTTSNIKPFHLSNDKVTTSAADSAETDNVVVLSDGDTSSNEDFEEVSENTSLKDQDSVEIVIVPSEKLDDDLFSDIFNKEEKKGDTFEIVIQPQANLDDDLFKDIFDEKKEQVSSNEKFETETSNVEIKNDEKSSVSNDRSSISDQNEVKILESESYTKNANNEHDIIKQPNEEATALQNNVEIETLNLEQMTKLKNDLQREKIDIMVEKSVKERMANNITDQMYQEAQDLLELFGVPYLIAPMEAEAQCAFLDTIELTDGTITDDSDIWLFGGRTVYKNFFNQSKYVMEFRAENIKHHFKLTREQMILLALLVGSDYTVGVHGVGPVTALEILAAFPTTDPKEFNLSHSELLSGLKEFSTWFNKGKSTAPGRSALKNKLKNISFSDNFPSMQVVQAYLEPTVETSKEKFSWSKPDFVGLTEFAKEKFGWSPKKAEEILKPVIKKVEETQTQKTIKDFFKRVYKADSTDAQNQMSKRVKSAINRIGKTKEELISEEMEALSKEKQKRGRNKRSDTNSNSAKDKNVEKEAKAPKRSRKKKSENTTEKSQSILNNEANGCPEVEEPKQKKIRNVAKNGTEVVVEEEAKAPKRSRKKKIESTTEKNQSILNNEANGCTKVEEPKQKKIRNVTKNDTEIVVAPAESSEGTNQSNENSDELRKYENIAKELRKRRQRRIELSKIDDTLKKNKPPPKKNILPEVIPEILEEDEEIRLLKATTSTSLKRVEEIDRELKNELDQEVKKQCLPNIHKREVILQKQIVKSDLLRNKMKAIEVFRKSKKGPGYIPKRGKKKLLPKEEAELSEGSDD